MARPKVLVVEDDDVFRRVARTVLSSAFDVVDVAGGQNALDMIDRGERFEAILCDLNLVGMSGRTFIEHLRSRSPEQASRVVLMSGSDPPSDLVELWLAKPFTAAAAIEVLNRVRDAAAKAATRRFAPIRTDKD